MYPHVLLHSGRFLSHLATFTATLAELSNTRPPSTSAPVQLRCPLVSQDNFLLCVATSSVMGVVADQEARAKV